MEDRQFVGVALRPAGGDRSTAAALDEVVATSLRAAEISSASLLVAAFGGEVRALLSAAARQDADRVVDRLVT